MDRVFILSQGTKSLKLNFKIAVGSLKTTQKQYTVRMPQACLWSKSPRVRLWLHHWLVGEFGQAAHPRFGHLLNEDNTYF